MPTNLKTKESLIKALRQSAANQISADELRKQRVSFVIGSLPVESNVTRAQVNEVVENFEGRKRA